MKGECFAEINVPKMGSAREVLKLAATALDVLLWADVNCRQLSWWPSSLDYDILESSISLAHAACMDLAAQTTREQFPFARFKIRETKLAKWI